MPHVPARPLPRRPALIVAGLVLGYVAAFLLLSPVLGVGATFLSVLPVVTVAWLFGLRAGIAAALASLAVTVFLRQSVEPFAWATLLRQGFPGTLMLVFIAGVVGWSRELGWRVRAEAAERQRAEAQLRAIVEGAAIGIALADASGRIVESNTALARLLGYTVEELGRQTISSITHPDDVARNLELHREMLDGRRDQYQVEKRYLHKGGGFLWGRLTVSPVRGGDGTGHFVIGMIEDITERKAAEEALRRAEARYRDLFENASDMIYSHDMAGRVIAINRAAERVFGWSAAEVAGQPVARWVAPASQARLVKVLGTLHAPGPIVTRPFEIDLVQRDGSLLPVEINTRVLYADGVPIAVEGIMRDITERKRAEAALRASEERLRTVVTNAPVALFALDPAGVFTLAEGKGLNLLGLAAGDLVGRPIAEVFGDAPRTLADLRRALEGEALTTIAELADLSFEASYVPFRDEGGMIAGVIGVATDITQRRVAEAQLTHQAYHDPLTDLPNRLLFGERVAGALATTGRRQGTLATLFLDLDRFKIVNDSLGHEVGDRLLVAVAERLLACVRPGDMVARLGGDEFTVLLDGIAGEEEATRIAARMGGALGRPFQVGGHEVVVTASIGIVIAGVDDTAADLLRYADMAMYQAKGAGKARHAIFDRSLGAAALARLELEADLRHALERGEFTVAYQPQVGLDTGRIVGAEALVRWRHPARGLVPPGDFIPLAEETGLILPLGRWVLGEACREASRWRERRGAGMGGAQDAAPTVSVNLSVRQFQDPELVPAIAAILAETGLPADALTLEITESTVMEEATTTRGTLGELARLGARLAIDDFGTGYSSLSYLKRFPVETIKIDKAFVAGLGHDPEDEAIVGAVVALGHGLGLRVCAEGVETPEQAALLRRLGCNVGQGYHFAPPLPATAFADALEGRWGAALADRDEAFAGAELVRA